MKLYVASSWRNKGPYTTVLALLREAGHVCYDFMNPKESQPFNWRDIDPDWQGWDFAKYREALLTHERSHQGFKNDFEAMKDADGCVLVQPCGVSAHLEAGWFAGCGRPVVSIGMPREPDLMLRMVDALFDKSEMRQLLDWLLMEALRLVAASGESSESVVVPGRPPVTKSECRRLFLALRAGLCKFATPGWLQKHGTTEL